MRNKLRKIYNTNIKQLLITRLAKKVGLYCYTKPVITGHQSFRDLDHKFSIGDDVYLVYQYGKSGSSSMYSILNEQNKSVFHCHHLNSKNLNTVEQLMCHPRMPRQQRSRRFITNARYRLYRNYLDIETRPIKIITTLREPQAYIRSVFFQNLKVFQNFIREQYESIEPRNLVGYFEKTIANIDEWLPAIASGGDKLISMISHRDDIDVAYFAWQVHQYIHWFDDELGEVFNIHLHDLCTHDGFYSYQKKNIQGVVIRMEDLDLVAHKAVNLLTGNVIDKVPSVNVGSNRDESETYERFKDTVSIPVRVMDHLCSCWHAQKFYPAHRQIDDHV